MRQKVQYEAVEGFRREAPNGRKAMMSWRFCDDRSRSVTRSSHRVKVTTIQAPGSADQLLTNFSHPFPSHGPYPSVNI